MRFPGVIATLVFAVSSFAQTVPLSKLVITSQTAPSGTCTTASAPIQMVRTTGALYRCVGGQWTDIDIIYPGNLTVDGSALLQRNGPTATAMTDVVLTHGVYNSSKWIVGGESRNQLEYAQHYPNTSIDTTGSTSTVTTASYFFEGSTNSGSMVVNSDSDDLVVAITNTTGTGLPTSIASSSVGWFSVIEGRSYSQPIPGTITIEAKYDDALNPVGYNNPAGNGTTWRTVASVSSNTQTVRRTTVTLSGATGNMQIYGVRWTLTDWDITGTYRCHFTLSHLGEELWPQYVNRFQSSRFPMYSALRITLPATGVPFILSSTATTKVDYLNSDKVDGKDATDFVSTTGTASRGPTMWAFAGTTCEAACTAMRTGSSCATAIKAAGGTEACSSNPATYDICLCY